MEVIIVIQAEQIEGRAHVVKKLGPANCQNILEFLFEFSAQWRAVKKLSRAILCENLSSNEIRCRIVGPLV